MATVCRPPALPCPRCLCCAPVTLCAGDSDEPATPPPCFRLHITKTSKRLSGSGSSRIAAPWVQARVNLLALALIPPVRMHQLQGPIPPSHNSGPLRCCIFRLPAHPLVPLTAQSGTSNPELTSSLQPPSLILSFLTIVFDNYRCHSTKHPGAWTARHSSPPPNNIASRALTLTWNLGIFKPLSHSTS
jgi:hypothetical protein